MFVKYAQKTSSDGFQIKYGHFGGDILQRTRIIEIRYGEGWFAAYLTHNKKYITRTQF